MVPVNEAESIHVKESLSLAYQSISVMMVDSSLMCQSPNRTLFNSRTIINIVREVVWILWVVDYQCSSQTVAVLDLDSAQ